MTQLITQELAENSIKQFRFSWLRQRTVLAITIAVIVFFKPLVTRLYLLPSQLPHLLVILDVLPIMAAFMEILDGRNIAQKKKLLFLSSGLYIGMLVRMASSVFWRDQAINSLIERISITSRLGWISLMFVWENIVPSVCLIVHFVTQIYLLLIAWKTLGYFNDLKRGILIEVWVDRDIKKAVIAIFLSGCWIYPAISVIYFLLQ